MKQKFGDRRDDGFEVQLCQQMWMCCLFDFSTVLWG